MPQKIAPDVPGMAKKICLTGGQRIVPATQTSCM